MDEPELVALNLRKKLPPPPCPRCGSLTWLALYLVSSEIEFCNECIQEDKEDSECEPV